MRHKRAKKKLGRTTAHREAMYSNMLASLIEHGQIKTTLRKAKDLRSFAERNTSVFLRLGDLLEKDPDKMTQEERAKVVHATRMVRRNLRNPDAVIKLRKEWAPKLVGRAGGYTRLFKLPPRRGDNADMAMISFVVENEEVAAAAE